MEQPGGTSEGGQKRIAEWDAAAGVEDATLNASFFIRARDGQLLDARWADFIPAVAGALRAVVPEEQRAVDDPGDLQLDLLVALAGRRGLELGDPLGQIVVREVGPTHNDPLV